VSVTHSLPVRPTLDQLRRFTAPPRVSYQTRVRGLPLARYHGPYRGLDSITLVVMHATAGGTAEESIQWLNRHDSDDPASYNYVIGHDGTIWRMCPATLVAYHAGDSQWPNPQPYPPGNVYQDEDGETHHHTVNGRALGIAWANRNDGTEPLTDEQIQSALWLLGVYVPTTSVQRVEQIRAHAEVSPGRKTDPAPCMDMDVWRRAVDLYLRSEG